MKHLFLSIILGLVLGSPCWAQSPLKEITVQYDKLYQLEKSYSIIYDNPSQVVKLNEFKVEFYDKNRVKLFETKTETYPLTGTLESYSLLVPVIGFNEVKLVILSLHEGDAADFPSVANSILALNQLSEYEEIETETSSSFDSAQPNETDPVSVDNSETQTEIIALKNQIETLSTKIINLEDRNRNQSQLITNQVEDIRHLEEQIADLKFLNVNQTKTINKLNQMLKNPLESLEERDNVIETQARDIEKLNAEIKALKSKPSPQSPRWPWQIATVALGTLAIGLGTALLRKPKTPPQPPLSNLNSLRRLRPSKPLKRPDAIGTIFAGSPLLAANVAAPLSAAGQLTASSLQMLSGQFNVLRPAYRATGRIGYAQEGKPTSEDYAFGTGFLVSPNHVITNRHVHGFYSEYLTGEECGGIEFIAEKDKDASDFYEFDGNPPVLIPGLDIAIYTLAKTVENRKPIAQRPLSTESLEGRDIVVVGYPDSFNPDDPEILAAMEENPIFAVKRVSQGQIFRHSTDIDDPYGVQATVTKNQTEDFSMPAISHNASTMTGNSGSPILDAKTGELLGVHFAGYKIFNNKEAANLAMAIEYIVHQQKTHSDLKTSTGLQTA